MEKLKDFDIQVYKLGIKQHEYEFTVNSDFFSNFEGELVKSGEVKIQLLLDKRENIIELNFDFSGFVDLISDRSLEPFQYPIDIDKKLLYKYGEEEQELEEDVMVITKNTQVINVGHFIYETIALQIPLKKLHPDEIEEDEEHNEYVYIDDAEEDIEEEEEKIDPRWEALKNLNKKK
ncbi:YceD family protein [Marivirga sp.]|uniref:YceD family protein n=1 Tax=Marivirga sp. TaxID=2018662 RepID=UPI003DA78522